MGKIEKNSAGYVLALGVDYFCSECAYISEQGKCTMYTPEDENVSRYGSCILWTDLRNGRLEGNHSRTRRETAYEENQVGFSCKRCDEFVVGKSLCKKVDETGPPAPGMIHPDGCCNLWEKSPTRGDMSTDRLVQILPVGSRPDNGELTRLFRTVARIGTGIQGKV